MTGSSGVNGPLWGRRARDWADIQEGVCRAVYAAVLERCGVGEGTRYLDLGCGSGMAAQMAAARGARVSGVDASAELLAIARERTPDGDSRSADLQSLPFTDAAFDVVTAFNAVQYAADPTAALIEAARVLAPGGVVVVVMTWGEPEGMAAASLVTALRPLLPSPPLGAPGPFALSDEAWLRALFASAGLAPRALFDVDSPFAYPDEATAVRGLNASGVAARAVDHSCEAAVAAAHRAALEPFRQADGSYLAPARFRCLMAERAP